jgi:hypothetical protein
LLVRPCGTRLAASIAMSKRSTSLLLLVLAVSAGRADASVVRTERRFQWDGGIVPFVIQNGFHPQARQFIVSAIDHWNRNSFIQLRPRVNETNFVKFVPVRTKTCSSPVGRQNTADENAILLDVLATCGTGRVIHEIGHIVGLHHEHQRNDRDDHIHVDFNNVDPNFVRNFDFASTLSGFDAQDWGPFDWDSVMLGSSKDFSRNGLPTMVRRSDGSQFTGQRTRLSLGDQSGVAEMYFALAFQGWSETSLDTRAAQFPPALASWGEGHLAAFMVDWDGQLFMATSSNGGSSWSDWSHLGGGTFKSAPAVTSRAERCLDVVAQGLDDRFYINSLDLPISPQWSGWREIPSGTFSFAPTIVALDRNTLEIFGTGMDSRVWTNKGNGHTWSGWRQLQDFVVTAAPAALKQCSLLGCGSTVFVRGDDMKIWSGTHVFGTWHGFQPSSAQKFISAPAAVGRAAGDGGGIFGGGLRDNSSAFAIQEDGQVYVTHRAGVVWTTWKPLQGAIFAVGGNAGVAAARWPTSGQIHLLGIAGDQRFRKNSFTRGVF